ncbi:MAG TPA: GGDEF domain-containing protein [Anaeromyxobacter sp.]|nr:GGDEF domain-containing protein [Anaeromyxobacter sp.]
MAGSDEHERTWTAIPRLVLPDRSHAFLMVLAGPHFGDVFPLEPGRDLVIGRREDADIQISDEGVSRRHAVVRVEGEGALLRDLGSVNGTWVDGARVSEARLVDGSRVAIGGATTFKFAWTDALEARWQLKVAQSALQDPLTGLFNRRHLEDRLVAELAAAQRHAREMSLLLADVDHFKEVNDAHGHLAGDEALKMIAFVLRGALRKEDVVARYGGEEFMVIARETPLLGGTQLAERIRRAVERSRFAWQGHEVGLTVSIGVTVSVGLTAFEPGRSDRDLIAAADRALYLAKQGGRNRVVALRAGAAPPG